MSAKVENLTERLKVVMSMIESRKACGQSYDELTKEQLQLESDLRKARSLLTEGNNTKVLRG